MNFTYSANNNMFYPYEYRSQYELSGDWPSDGRDVTDEIFAEYTGKAPEGKRRASGSDGYPAWEDIPPRTHDEEVAVSEAERQGRINQANNYISSKQWPGKVALGRLSDTDKAQYNLWLDYLDALEAIDTASAPDINWPESPEV